jgi:uncharacterized protein (TIGR02145 family)
MKQFFTLLAFVLLTASTYAQVGIGTTTPAGALDIVSTTSGLVLSRVANTSVVVNPNGGAIENGTMVYDLSANCVKFYANGAWTGCIQFAAAAPGAPVIGTATAGNVQATVSFTAPSSNGGAAITSYTATSSPGNITGTISQAGSGSITVAGLTNGTPYTFTVMATNAAGNSVASAPSATVTPSLPFVTSQVSNGTGGFYTFLSHNLGADTSLDPHTPVVGIQGAYIQWGRRGPNTTGDSRVDWQTAGNTDNFAAAPTGADENADNISVWSSTTAANGSWGATKTANDPCPTGYRVPTSAEWIGVNSNNTESRTGTFTTGSTTQYGSALHYGPDASTKLLTLPAAGLRFETNGRLSSRGSVGVYWSSVGDGGSSFYLDMFGTDVYWASGSDLAKGYSLRCIAE